VIASSVRSPSGRIGRVGSLLRFWHRHPERGLAAVALAAWVALLFAGHSHSFWGRQTGWMLMLAAMMIPPALPMARHVMQNSKRHRRQRAGLLFAGTSLLPWAVAGAGGVGLVSVIGLDGYRRWLLGGSLLVAAAWELTPDKRRALKACHRTLPLPPDGRKADRACCRLGLQYGKACFRACWALMLPMVLAGHPGVVLMLVLTGIAVAEEVVRKGYRLASAAAVLLTVAGMMVLVLG
jgi:predicted metal-binding membrane protein